MASDVNDPLKAFGLYRYHLSCPCCQQEHMDPNFIKLLIALKQKIRFALPIAQGFVCSNYYENALLSPERFTLSAYQILGRGVILSVCGPFAQSITAQCREIGIHGVMMCQDGPLRNRYLVLDNRPKKEACFQTLQVMPHSRVC